MTLDMQQFSTGDALATMADQFGQLAVSLADGADQPLTQQRLVEFAVRGIPGAEHASMTVVDGNRPPRTTAQSDELPYQWDQLQYEHGEGPCLEAIATNGVELAPDLRTENRWPLFARAIVDQTPARSMLSFRLFLTEQNRAALNLYATRPGAFTDQSTATGAMFAAYASMALLAAARHDKANHLTPRVGDQPGDRGRDGHSDGQRQAHQPAGFRPAAHRQPELQPQTPRHRRRRRPHRTTCPRSPSSSIRR